MVICAVPSNNIVDNRMSDPRKSSAVAAGLGHLTLHFKDFVAPADLTR